MRGRTKTLWNVLLLLFQRKFIELLPESKLTVDAFLGNIEVFDVEEAILSDCLDESLSELFLTLRSVVEA